MFVITVIKLNNKFLVLDIEKHIIIKINAPAENNLHDKSNKDSKSALVHSWHRTFFICATKEALPVRWSGGGSEYFQHNHGLWKKINQVSICLILSCLEAQEVYPGLPHGLLLGL